MYFYKKDFIRKFWFPFADIPNVPVPDVPNNLDKDDVDESIPYEAIERLPSYQQLPLRSNYYYERPGNYFY